MAPYVIQAGEEIVDVLYLKTSNAQGMYFNGVKTQLRPFGHHLIVGQSDRDLTDGLFKADLPPVDFDILLGATAQALDASPESAIIAPENEGLASYIGPNKQIALNAHFVNTGDKPALREAWVNLYYTDAAKVTAIAAPVFLIGGIGMEVHPRTRQLIKASAVAKQDLRLVWLFGHFHAHTQRFSAYIKRPSSAERELVYETYDYADPAYIYYSSVTQTAAPNRDAKISGGSNGLLEIKAGDTIEWECDVENNDDIVLRWANEIQTAEMCSLFGLYTPAPEGQAWRVLHP